jgi:hypothetical protein
MLTLSRIDLLKIDTEGHELEVLHGARKLLAAGLIRVLHIEFNEMNVFSRVFLRDFRELLSRHTAYRMLPGIISVSDSPLASELFAFQNVVFVPNWKSHSLNERASEIAVVLAINCHVSSSSWALRRDLKNEAFPIGATCFRRYIVRGRKTCYQPITFAKPAQKPLLG